MGLESLKDFLSPTKIFENGILGKIKNFFSSDKGKETPREVQQGLEVKKEGQKERTSLFKEMGKSFLLRQFPKGGAMWDLMGATGVVDRGAEAVPWQHEFETITAIIRFLPNGWKKWVTKYFSESVVFQKVVANWPIASGVKLPLISNEDLGQRVKAGDPDAVIDALRIIHQDVFVTGKVSVDKLKDLIASAK